ncbi:MAG: LysE family translocator [Steroidobacterales bacterium]
MFAHLFSTTQIGVLLAAALVLALTPGPGIMYVMGGTLSEGPSNSLASTPGTAVGGMVQLAVATAGLSALLAVSAKPFLVVKYAAAIYLVFLGVRSILRARLTTLGIPAVPPHGARQMFLEGILMEALNINTALFFLAFVPQFVDHTLPIAPQFAMLGLVCVCLNTAGDFLVVLLPSRLSGYFWNSPKSARYSPTARARCCWASALIWPYRIADAE